MAPAEIDFTALSAPDALDLAILIEDEAEERYEELAHQLDIHRTPDAAAFFRSMARNEAIHRTRLRERRTRLFGDAPRTVSRALLWDVEAPEYDEARAFMTVRQAMETALRSEEKAHAYFVAALEHVREAEVRTLLEELRDDEVLHQDMIRREMARLGAEAEIDTEDFTDEPTPQ
jgi:erythrin-vacuolar iron transport family protein